MEMNKKFMAGTALFSMFALSGCVTGLPVNLGQAEEIKTNGAIEVNERFDVGSLERVSDHLITVYNVPIEVSDGLMLLAANAVKNGWRNGEATENNWLYAVKFFSGDSKECTKMTAVATHSYAVATKAGYAGYICKSRIANWLNPTKTIRLSTKNDRLKFKTHYEVFEDALVLKEENYMVEIRPYLDYVAKVEWDKTQAAKVTSDASRAGKGTSKPAKKATPAQTKPVVKADPAKPVQQPQEAQPSPTDKPAQAPAIENKASSFPTAPVIPAKPEEKKKSNVTINL
jgi:hypothetical protein